MVFTDCTHIHIIVYTDAQYGAVQIHIMATQRGSAWGQVNCEGTKMARDMHLGSS